MRTRKKHSVIPQYALHYLQSKELRYIGNTVLLPVGYIQHHPPLHRKKAVNKYTEEGRKLIHKQLQNVDMRIVHALMRNPIRNATIEYNDNRISRFVGQAGKCAVTQQPLLLEEIHCHHQKPRKMGGNDSYANLVIVKDTIHRLIHATTNETIQKILNQIQLDKKQLKKLNQFRVLAGNEKI